MSARAGTSLSTTFSSLRVRNYRLFAIGQLIANTGGWTQRIAQDWLVITLTGSATAVGITTALQFLPTLLFGLVGGLIADRFPKRRVLQFTQCGMAVMAATLAFLTLTHQIRTWQVWVVAFLLGTIIAIDNPTRQSFVNELVGPDQLRNAISLNASIFQLGGLIGPALSGLLITWVGPGYSFLINAISYCAPFAALALIRTRDLTLLPRAEQAARMSDGVRYATADNRIIWPIVLVGAFGLFTINLPVTLTAYAKDVLHSGAGGYGLLSAVVAFGSMSGALLSASGSTTRLRSLAIAGSVLASVYCLAAAAPTEAVLLPLLVLVGASTLSFLTKANATVQLAAADAIRGRVMGLYLLVFIGSGSLGGPLIGLVDQRLGPHAGLALAGVVPGLVLVAVSLKLGRSTGLFEHGLHRPHRLGSA